MAQEEMNGEEAPAVADLPALIEKVESENQLLQVKNAHLLNLLTESCSNCQALAARVHEVDQLVVKSPSHVGSP